MVIYLYTLPALLAFVSKIAILVISLRAERHNFQTRLFIVALLGSMVINVAEIGGLQKLIAPEHAVILHYAAHITTLALLAHLAVSVSLNKLSGMLLSAAGIVIYTYALMLEGLLVFTPALVAGAEPLGNYTYTRVAGSFYWMYEIFMVAGMLAITVLPAWGLRSGQEIAARNRCKLWIVLSTPLAILILTILTLLHLGFRWFNATVTTPLLIAAFLAAVGYAVHHRRPIDLNFYLPGSRLKKSRMGLYAQLAAYNNAIPHFHSVDALLDRFAEILRCPVRLVGSRAPSHGTSKHSPLSRLPRKALQNIDRMVVASEIREQSPELHALMVQYDAAAIIPFFPHSSTVRHWLLLGNPFSRHIYMSRDFKHLEQLFEKMAGLLLDMVVRIDRQRTSWRQPADVSKNIFPGRSVKHRPNAGQIPSVIKISSAHSKRTLPESVAEFEAELIRQVLASCDGNQAQAARFLGIRPNTLHYKIERYGLSVPSTG